LFHAKLAFVLKYRKLYTMVHATLPCVAWAVS